MQAKTVSLQAELLVRQAFAAAPRASFVPGAKALTVDSIELFVDALDPHKVIFGTARVDDKKVPLPESLLRALSALSMETPKLTQAFAVRPRARLSGR